MTNTSTAPAAHPSPAHQALSDYTDMLDALDGRVVTVTVVSAPVDTLAAQIRAVLASQSQYMGAQ